MAERDEFARLVREQKDTIYTVCYMFSADADEVSDLFQEVLINLWRGYRQFRHESGVKTYVWRIALNTCITADRKRKRRREREKNAGLTDLNVSLYGTADASGTDARQARLLHDRIARLGVFDRAIVLLWLEDLSYEEIGAIVGISARNVGVRLFRIREILKRGSSAGCGECVSHTGEPTESER
ncbi:MAG: sigma-70 family RNA polymerase sigma factor [Bacteroidales bacterium]|nr:sigma-70 family RNA polymerase sigma factor [Bacteroidales bacterium]